MKFLITSSIFLVLFSVILSVPVNKNEQKKVKFIRRIFPQTDSYKFGQVSALDKDNQDHLFVFHRASRRWEADSFIDNGVEFNRDQYPAIAENTVELVDRVNFKPINAWGKNKFYMPHGLTYDHEGYVWIIDAGLHQIFKFDPKNPEKPILTLGEAFVAGNDAGHFCKPTDVAVSRKNGDIFISDGYCNRRVVQFTKDGVYKKKYEAKIAIRNAHSIALIEDQNLICTVSRSDGRIICFDINTESVRHTLIEPEMRQVYAIEYDPVNEVIHAATGINYGIKSIGLTFSANAGSFGKLLQKWDASVDLKDAHDIAVSEDGSRIYLAQLNGSIDEFSYE